MRPRSQLMISTAVAFVVGQTTEHLAALSVMSATEVACSRLHLSQMAE